MDEMAPDGGIRDRLAARGEEVLGKLTTELLGNGAINAALTRAFEARGKATEAQQLAMSMLNIPTAGDIERLTRRVRAVSQRLETIEDALARIEVRLSRADAPLAERLGAIEEQLADAARLLGELHAALPDGPAPVSPGQERMRVETPQPTGPASEPWYSRATPLD
jgi:DNA repair exonuclease SbcCD ATPase subunit